MQALVKKKHWDNMETWRIVGATFFGYLLVVFLLYIMIKSRCCTADLTGGSDEEAAAAVAKIEVVKKQQEAQAAAIAKAKSKSQSSFVRYCYIVVFYYH